MNVKVPSKKAESKIAKLTKKQLSKTTGGAEAVKTTLGPRGRN